MTFDMNHRYLYLPNTFQNPMRFPKIEPADKHFMSRPVLIYVKRPIYVRKKSIDLG